MSYVSRQLASGVLLAEDSQDSASVERALKQRDRDLSLQGWPSVTHGCIIWKVVRYAGPDRPPETICVWQSDRGEPYPLSSGLLDKVDQLDKNGRTTYLNEDQRDEIRRDEIAKVAAQRDQDLVDDHVPKHGRPITPRSQALRRSRDKQRARGENV